LVELLAIQAGAHACGLRLNDIAGLFVDKRITRVPHSAGALRGVAGFRGALVPVYDLQALFTYGRAQQPRWLVIVSDKLLALAFDTFVRQLRVEPAQIVPHSTRIQVPGFTREFVRSQTFTGPILHLPSVLEAISASGTRVGATNGVVTT
jgi:purine-binding chemotaxis protein CheW